MTNSLISFWACMVLAHMHATAGNTAVSRLFFGLAMLNVLAQLVAYVRKEKQK